MTDTPARKLAVILHADVVGSTALVQKNESVAHERMQDAFRRFSATIGAYNGITHELRGDALVAEFARASDAVSAALLFQSQNVEHNAALDDDIHPRLRIGISLGEVVIADDTVTGEGIILAQRLEQLAEPDGVVVQGTVSETVPTRLSFEFDNLGEQSLKGFEHPVRAFTARLSTDASVPEPEIPAGSRLGVAAGNGRKKTVVLVAAAAVLVAAVFAYHWYSTRDRDVLELPRGPRVAVMPFTNLGIAEDRRFSDGLTQDVISALSQFSNLFVISRETTAQLRSKGADCRQIRDELNADHIVEGTVRRSSEALRVTVQLFDGSDCSELWSETYDRELTAANVFAVQDDITSRVASTVGTLDLRLWKRQLAIAGARTDSLEAYDCVLMGEWYYETFGADRHARARDCLERAVEIDPGYSLAHSGLGHMYFEEFKYGHNLRPEPVKRALERTEKAIELDPRNAGAFALLAFVRYATECDFEVFYDAVETAIAINPNDADPLAGLGIYMIYSGAWERGKALVSKAKSLNPLHQSWYDYGFCIDYFQKGEYSESLKCHLEANMTQNHMVQTTLAATYGHLGEVKSGQKVIAHILSIRPEFGVDPRAPFRSRRMPNDFVESVMEGLRKAGHKVTTESADRASPC